MMTRSGEKNRGQIEFTSIDELVPEDHLVRKLEKAIDWSFIYDLVEDSYCENNGRPSLDPVILLKLPVLQYMFGIRSMRQTIQEIKVNTAYRWFLGLGLHDAVPHFSTFGKNYMRRFQAKELHGFRYTQQFGKAQMEVKAALTFACMNLKKLAKKRWKTDRSSLHLLRFLDFFGNFFNIYTTNPLPA